MPNLLLFGAGLIVTLVSGMGILIYMTSLGYKEKKKHLAEPETHSGSHQIDEKKVESLMDSFVHIPSVS